MITTAAYAAVFAKSQLGPHIIERRDPGPHEVLIDILYCGVCHSDIHQVRDERVMKSDVHYRYVIDIASLKKS